MITVVLNALMAQSNMPQPKISRLSFTIGCVADVKGSLLRKLGVSYTKNTRIGLKLPIGALPNLLTPVRKGVTVQE